MFHALPGGVMVLFGRYQKQQEEQVRDYSTWNGVHPPGPRHSFQSQYLVTKGRFQWGK